MGSNALEQAKRAQHDAAITTFVRLPLNVLEALIAEIEHLNTELNETTDLLAKTTSKNAEVSGMVQRIGSKP